jgi:lipopolysaccharide/colanic/teichoic acid biosynthesis glycosyltransferase
MATYQPRTSFYTRHGKRWFDFVFGGAAAVATLPLQALVAGVVRWKLGSPVIFRQDRPGQGERLFSLAKFRTMTDARDEFGRLLPDEVRLTPFGAWLRATSLDELPELWSVVRGDMSLVGPRPLLEKYLPLYTSRQQHRHDVRPGLTGLAQSHGRNALDWHTRLELDVVYAEHVSLMGDLRILARSVAIVVGRRGITEPGQAKMSTFEGAGSAAAGDS